MRLGASIVTEIPAPYEFEECAGVGDIGGKPFMWTIDDNHVVAVFDSGEFIEFEHGEEGWKNLVLMGLFLSKSL